MKSNSIILNLIGIALMTISWAKTGTFNGLALLGGLLVALSYINFSKEYENDKNSLLY